MDPRDPKRLGLNSHINTYNSPQAMHPTPYCPHRQIPTSSHITTNHQPNRSICPEAESVHIHDRAHRPDALASLQQSPCIGHTTADGASRCIPSAPATPPAHHAHTTSMLMHRPTPPRRGCYFANPISSTTHTLHSP